MVTTKTPPLRKVAPEPTTAAAPQREAHELSDRFADPDLVDRIFEYLTAELPEIRERAAELQRQVRAEFAGEEAYVAKRSPTERQRLVEGVLALFNGRNATEVARRLQIGRTTVYRVLKQAKAP